MTGAVRHRINLIVTAIALPVLLISLFEVGLRVVGYGSESDFFVEIPGQDALTTNPNFARQFFPPALARLPSPLRVRFDKPDSVTRVVVLGGSAAMGEPDPSFSFSRFLDVMLSRVYPDRSFEVVNASMATINSHVVRVIASELYKIQPDYVLIYMGNNEVVGPFGAGTVFGTYSPSLTLIRLGIYLRTFRIGQLLENAARWVSEHTQFVTEGQGMAAFRDQYVQALDPRMAVIYDHFRENLGDIVALSESSGARVIVSTVGTNLVDHAPFGSFFGQEGADPITWGRLFAEGVAHTDAGRWTDAIAAFVSANRVDSTHAELHFRLGQLYRQAGDVDRSRRHFIRARDLDVLRFRADSRVNDILRSVPMSIAVLRADGAQWLADADTSVVGLPGRKLFHEHVHLTADGNFVLARGFADVLHLWLSGRTHYWGEPPASPGTPSQAECEQALALTPFDRYRLHESVAGLMQRAPFTGQFDYLDRLPGMNRRSAVLRSQGTGFAGIGRSMTLYQAAVEARPSDLTVLQNYARLLQDSGALVNATALWKRLLDEVPNTPTWMLAMATSLSDQGAHNAALQYYEQLASLMPGLVLPHIQIGYEYVSTGQIGEAIHVLQEALEINPGSTVARMNLASLLADVDQSEAAMSLLDAGLALVESRDDAHASAQILVSRSDLWLRQGQGGKAVDDLRAAAESFELAGDVQGEGMTRLAMAKAYRASGDLVAAERTLREGLLFAGRYAVEEITGQMRVELGAIAMSQGSQKVAASEFRTGHRIFESLSDRHPALPHLEPLIEQAGGSPPEDQSERP